MYMGCMKNIFDSPLKGRCKWSTRKAAQDCYQSPSNTKETLKKHTEHGPTRENTELHKKNNINTIIYRVAQKLLFHEGEQTNTAPPCIHNNNNNNNKYPLLQHRGKNHRSSTCLSHLLPSFWSESHHRYPSECCVIRVSVLTWQLTVRVHGALWTCRPFLWAYRGGGRQRLSRS